MVKKLSNEILISIAVVVLCGSVLIFSAVTGNGSGQQAIASELQQTGTNTPLIAQNNTSPEESMDLSNAQTTDSGLKYIVIEEGDGDRKSVV